MTIIVMITTKRVGELMITSTVAVVTMMLGIVMMMALMMTTTGEGRHMKGA